MSAQESKDILSTFPLTQHEFLCLRGVAAGETPSSLSVKNEVSPRAIKQTLTAIKTKLVARTPAQAVWKAWNVGLEVTDKKEVPEQTVHPLGNSLSGNLTDILRRIAGGYHAIELDEVLKISQRARIQTINQLYVAYHAKTHPQLIAEAIESGFFREHTPIPFSSGHNFEQRPRDSLTTYQQQILELVAEGKTYPEIAEITSNSKDKTSQDGIRRTLNQVRTKIAILSGQAVKGPLQTATTAVDLGLISMDLYLESLGLDPSTLSNLPKSKRNELERVYEKAMTTGQWAEGNNAQRKRLRALYKEIGSENPTQAIMMIHSLKHPSKEDNIGTTIMLSVPNGPTAVLGKKEVDAVKDLGAMSLRAALEKFPDSGRVTGEAERNGGRIITLLTRILRGNTQSFSTSDLDYRELRLSYNFIAGIIDQHPDIPVVGNLLNLIDRRLKKLKEASKT